MRGRLLVVIVIVALVAAVGGVLRLSGGAVQQGATAGPAPRTAWGDPDLQGIWTDPYQTPLQRPAQFANKESFTDEERAALDAKRAAIPRRDQRVERGSERDVAGAYNAVFQSVRPTGKRTSLIVDPPDGHIPPLRPRRRRGTKSSSSTGWHCCSRPRRARRKMPRAPEESTARFRPGGPTCRPSTTPVARIETTVPKIAA